MIFIKIDGTFPFFWFEFEKYYNIMNRPYKCLNLEDLNQSVIDEIIKDKNIKGLIIKNIRAGYQIPIAYIAFDIILEKRKDIKLRYHTIKPSMNPRKCNFSKRDPLFKCWRMNYSLKLASYFRINIIFPDYIENWLHNRSGYPHDYFYDSVINNAVKSVVWNNDINLRNDIILRNDTILRRNRIEFYEIILKFYKSSIKNIYVDLEFLENEYFYSLLIGQLDRVNKELFSDIEDYEKWKIIFCDQINRNNEHIVYIIYENFSNLDFIAKKLLSNIKNITIMHKNVGQREIDYVKYEPK